MLVVNDELIASKSVDIESEKCVNQRKQYKVGPVVDYISCSLTSVMHGIRLKLKDGQQENNVVTLIGHLTKLTNPFHSITFVLIEAM